MPSEKTYCLHGGPVFDGRRLIPNGAILFSRKRVMRVVPAPEIPPAHEMYDVGGRLIAPGLVDLHSDTLEKCIEVRPGVLFDAEFALQNLDRRVAACGITTFCHALSFADNEFGLE